MLPKLFPDEPHDGVWPDVTEGTSVEVRPDINDSVVIRDEDGHEYASRVEDLTDDVITLARPFNLPATDPIEPGTELLISWPCTAGVAVLPAELAGTRIARTIALWDMAIIGEAWTEQRRAHVRVAADGPVTLVVDTDDGPRELSGGYLVDVGEAAMQCSITDPTADGLLTTNTPVTACFTLQGEQFALPGRVFIRRAPQLAGERSRLVVAFDHDRKNADALRKQVFAQQLRIHRMQRA